MNIKLVSVFLFALFIGSFGKNAYYLPDIFAINLVYCFSLPHAGGHDDKTDEDKDGSQATIVLAYYNYSCTGCYFNYCLVSIV